MSVYYALAPDLDLVKIGFAERPKKRFSKIQSDSPVRIVLVAVEDGDEATEAARHQQFAAFRQRGEWFRNEGALRDHVTALPPIPAKEPSMNGRLVALGMSKTYASQILSGKQRPPISLAILIFRETGWKHERIAQLTEQQMALLEEIEPWQPRAAAA